MNRHALAAMAILISLAIVSGAMLVFVVVLAQMLWLAAALIGWLM